MRGGVEQELQSGSMLEQELRKKRLKNEAKSPKNDNFRVLEELLFVCIADLR